MIPARPEDLQRVRLPDQVALAILRSVVSGETPPEQQLPTEHELGERFGVSRTVVREAVRILASKGLVEVKHGKGMWVMPPGAWDPLDTDIMQVRFEQGKVADTWRQIIEARRIFEVEIAGLAAQRRDEEDLAALARALRQMHAAAGDRELHRLADVEFHRNLVRAAHNPVLQRLLEPVHPLLLAGGLRPAPDMHHAVERHEQLLAAIRARDAAEARRLMVLVLPGVDAVDSDLLRSR